MSEIVGYWRRYRFLVAVLLALLWSLYNASPSQGQIFDNSFTSYPISENNGEGFYGGIGGGRCYPLEQAALLATYSFNLASHANNHAWDLEKAGMLATRNNVAKISISVSGSGLSLHEARRAVFVNNGKMRLALVSVA
ncbi:hypothetical protein EDB81DRAFT_884971 [Dactylonectria macrodidyma]|uniref:Capsule synthesis protein CapA domain-containing protein n=1 Tax=Dactylonectria macrodidyma TaxID=307937 RepID=A0A9P9ELX5_9HYPO|nr:hypothetical protein EDB81DRAFT_884971 [Dactylonectria macrodidyma]